MDFDELLYTYITHVFLFVMFWHIAMFLYLSRYLLWILCESSTVTGHIRLFEFYISVQKHVIHASNVIE